MWLLAKLKTYAAIAGAVVLAIVLAMAKGRADGRRVAKIKTYEQREELQEKYDEIDAQPIDFDSAISGLRDRSEKR